MWADTHTDREHHGSLQAYRAKDAEHRHCVSSKCCTLFNNVAHKISAYEFNIDIVFLKLRQQIQDLGWKLYIA